MCKSKIHRVKVTQTHIQYKGSVTIDRKLMDAADIYPGEKVQVVNLNNGARVESYCITGKPGSGVICLNGAAARWAEPGDEVIIITYCHLESAAAKKYKPRVVLVNSKNRVVSIRRSS